MAREAAAVGDWLLTLTLTLTLALTLAVSTLSIILAVSTLPNHKPNPNPNPNLIPYPSPTPIPSQVGATLSLPLARWELLHEPVAEMLNVMLAALASTVSQVELAPSEP